MDLDKEKKIKMEDYDKSYNEAIKILENHPYKDKFINYWYSNFFLILKIYFQQLWIAFIINLVY